MSDNNASARRDAAAPTFAELFTPKLITMLREGYRAKEFLADGFAGLTVAIFALPLSISAIRRELERAGLTPPKVAFASAIEDVFPV